MWAKYIVFGIIAVACLEVLVLWLNDRLQRGQVRDAALNISLSLIDKGLTVAVGIGLFGIVYGFGYQFRLFDFDNNSVLSWFAAILLSDFLYYWYHRVFHCSRFFWTVHSVHHSSELFNFSTSLRSSAIVSVVRWPFWVPMPLLGFTPKTTITTYIVVLAYQVWVHTEHIGKLGVLEKFLMTPSHHRVHHGSNKQYQDKNYGGMLCVWDRLFGTFEPEVETVVYGVTERMDSSNVFVVNFRDLVRLLKDVIDSRSMTDALGYVFAPPGWRPSPTNQNKNAAEISSANQPLTNVPHFSGTNPSAPLSLPLSMPASAGRFSQSRGSYS